MQNINGSLIKNLNIMKNSFSDLHMSYELSEYITRMNKQFGNIAKAYDVGLLWQNQSKFIEMPSQISKQLRDSVQRIQDIKDFATIPNTWIQFSKEMNAFQKCVYIAWQQYDYKKLSKIIQDTLKVYDYSSIFDVNAMAEQITETYIADEEAELTEKGKNFEISDKKEYIKNLRDWIGFCITIIGFFITIYSLVSTKPANTYHTSIEVNNYYVNDLEISAKMLNAMSYRIVVKNNVMPRVKPDCSSRVIGHLNMGQVVTVSQKYEKWVKIYWEDENDNHYSGWVQNYKLTRFK